jgi:hypothetical protein
LALLSCGVFRNRSMMGEPLFIKEQSTSFQKVQTKKEGHEKAARRLMSIPSPPRRSPQTDSSFPSQPSVQTRP